MTTLPQQLEDKKKGCKEQIEKYDLILKCGDWIPTEFDRIKVYCPQCQAEIAILEQAIAEMQKQRQDFISFLRRFDLNSLDSVEMEAETSEDFHSGNIWADTIIQNKIHELEQLNQPKTGK